MGIHIEISKIDKKIVAISVLKIAISLARNSSYFFPHENRFFEKKMKQYIVERNTNKKMGYLSHFLSFR